MWVSRLYMGRDPPPQKKKTVASAQFPEYWGQMPSSYDGNIVIMYHIEIFLHLTIMLLL